MRFLVGFLVFISSCSTLDREKIVKTEYRINNELVKIAIIDTGYDFNSVWTADIVGLTTPHVCFTGHTDFTGKGIEDVHGHGTHIAGLIAKYAGPINYCLVIYKYYTSDADNMLNLVRSNLALAQAIKEKVDIINYSGGGVLRNDVECALVTLALNRGIKVVAAAGNEGHDLDQFKFYPAACDSRVTVVVGVDKAGSIMRLSNYSSSGIVVTQKERGKDVLSTLPNGSYGYMSGTSQATAIASGKLAKGIALTTKRR